MRHTGIKKLVMIMGLRSDVYYCVVEERTVFLDLRGDRYFCINGNIGYELERLGKGLAACELPKLEPLKRRGLLVPKGTEQTNASAQITVPDGSLLDSARPPLRTGPIVSALIRQILAEGKLRWCPLRTIIGDIRLRKKMASPETHRDAYRNEEQIAAEFINLDLVRSGNNRCLARSIALLDHLAARGHYPDMVIGVRLDPFHAHCWVQNSRKVLTDTPDHVRVFTPILVV